MVYTKTSDNNYCPEKWMVDPTPGQGTHTTLAAATADASAGDTIRIRANPNPYTENFTPKAGVNYVADTIDGLTPNVTIVGKISISAAGTYSFSGIRLQTNNDNFLAVTGSAASVVNLYDCYLNVTNAIGIVNSSSSGSAYITFNRCQGNISTTGITLFTHSGAGITSFKYTDINNSGSSVTRSTCSAGGVFLAWSNMNCPITTSSTGFIGIGYSNMTGLDVPALIHGGRNDSSIQHSNLQGFNSPTITVNNTLTLQFCSVYSSSSPVINGSATMFAAAVVFSDNSTVTCTVSGKTMLAGPINYNNVAAISAGTGSPNGVVTLPQGSIWMRTNATTATTRAYSNTNSGTTWTGFNTVT